MQIVARSEPVTDEVVGFLADLSVAEAAGASATTQGLQADDLIESDSTQPSIRLLGVGRPFGVNALNSDASLDLHPDGLTIVYGENGSGKSGWARILKNATRARHSEPVLSDVFDSNPQPQRARITYTADGEEVDLVWPEADSAEMRSVSYYDAACGTHYLTSETEVAYRPAPLAMLDRLAYLCGQVRAELESRKTALDASAEVLPDVPTGSAQAAFLEQLSERTSPEQLADACTIPEDADQQMVELRRRADALASSDRVRERVRLEALAVGIPVLVNHLRSIGSSVGDESIRDLRHAAESAASLQRSAIEAATGQFSDEPLAGVGSPTWRSLWEAARSYSSSVSYPAHEFPVVEIQGEPARCVLCFQTLCEDARNRLIGFAAFVADETELEAQRATEAASAAVARVSELEVTPAEVATTMVHLQGEDPDLHSHVESALQSHEVRRESIVHAASDGIWDRVPDLVAVDEASLLALQGGIDTRLDDLDDADPATVLMAIQQEMNDLEGRCTLNEARERLAAEIARCQRVAAIEAAVDLTATHGITRKSVELTRMYVGAGMQERFRREAAALGLERVLLADAGGERGRLRHRTELDGMQQDVELRAVLSEGEKTALGLCAFLTEVGQDASGSAVVLDDPVSSMDHVRKKKVAARLAVLAAERQVVVFTHDIGFVIDLKLEAANTDVPLAELWIFKTRDAVGNAHAGHPWNTRTVPQRLGTMEQKLAEVRRALDGDPERYSELVRSWYQDLRLVWERMIEETVVGRVLNRGELQIRPQYVQGLVNFDETDWLELDAAFTRCGEMGSHDQSPYLNRPIAQIVELEQDLEVARSWHGRVKGYFRSQ